MILSRNALLWNDRFWQSGHSSDPQSEVKAIKQKGWITL